MEAANAVTADAFNALIQLRELEGPMSPELVHQRLCGYVDEMLRRAPEHGVGERDARDMAYAIVALADEIALSKTEPLRSFWMGRPLQLQYFNENTAGEGFFARVQTLRGDPRKVDVLRVYYVCLLLGFQGRYAIRGGDLELMRIVESLRNDIERQIATPDTLSPNGEPPDEPMVRASGKNPFLWVSLGIFAVAIALFIGLRVSLDSQVGEIEERVGELTR